ncbi:MAG: hypothetical protein K2X66_08505, partial [Cyanobacteria bacterium]|nr:hypothetical protein [Cyanobacteriota bacterium]
MKLFFLNQEGARNLLIRSGIACFLFLLLIGTLDLSLPYLINEQDIKAKIETGLQESLGTDVKIQSLALHPTLFHGLEVSLENSRLTAKSSLKMPSQPFATARSIHLYLRYLSLLDAAIYGNPAQIASASAEDLWLNITPESPLLHPPALKPTHKAQIVLNNTDLELKNFNLLFIGPTEKSLNPRPQQLKGKYLTLNHIESNLPYDLSGEVTWNREPEKRSIGTIQFQLNKLWCLSPPNLPTVLNITRPSTPINTETLIPLIHTYLQQPLLGQGKVDVLNLSLRNLSSATENTLLPRKIENIETVEKIQLGFSQQKQGHWLGFMDEASPKPGDKIDNVFQLMVKAPQSPWPLSPSHSFSSSTKSNPPSPLFLEGQLKVPETLDPPIASIPESSPSQPNDHNTHSPPSPDSTLNLQDISLQLKALDADIKIQGSAQLNSLLKNSKLHFSYWLDEPNLKALSLFKLSKNPYLKILGRWSGKLALNGNLQGALYAPRFSGVAELKDVALIPQNPLNTQGKLSGLSTKLKFTSDSFTMDPFYVTLENHPLSGTLQVFHDPKKIHQKPILTHWKGSLNIPNLPLESVTNFLQDPDIKVLLTKIPSPLDLSTIKGAGTLQTKTSFHTTLDESAVSSAKINTDLFGEVAFQDISLSMDPGSKYPLSQPISFISNLNGKIHFTPQKLQIQAPLRFDTWGEQSFGGHYCITGWYTPKRDASSLTLQGHQISLERVQKEILNLASILKTSPDKGFQQFSAALAPFHDLQLKGTGDIDLMLSGSPNALQPVGSIRFQEAGFLYNSSSKNFKGQLQGKHLLADIQITPERIFLKKASGIIEDALVEATGWWAHHSAQYHGALDVKNINLAQCFQKLKNISPPLAHNVEFIRDLSGTSHLSLILDSHDKTLVPQTKGTVRVDNLKIHALKLPYILEIPALAFALDSHQSLNLPPTPGKLGPWKFTAQGNIPLQKMLTGYTFKLATESLPLSLLHSENTTLQTLMNHSLPEIWETEGRMKLSLAVSHQKQTLWMGFQNAGLSFEGSDFPLSKINGALTLEGKTLDRGRLSIPELKAHYGNSDLHVVSHPDPQKPEATQILLEGKLSPLLLTHYLVPRDSGYTIDTGIPYTLDFSGHPIELFSVVEAGLSHPDLPPKIPSGNPNEILANLSYWLGIPTNSKDPSDWLNATGTLQMKGTDVALLDNQLEIPQVGILKLAGEIQDIFDPIDHNYNLQLLSDPPLDLGRSQKEGKVPGDPILRNASGTVSVDLFVKRNTDGTGTSKGFAKIDNLIIPALQLNPLNLDCKTENASAQCHINALHLPGVDLQLSGLADNILEIPVSFK